MQDSDLVVCVHARVHASDLVVCAHARVHAFDLVVCALTRRRDDSQMVAMSEYKACKDPVVHIRTL